MKKRSLFSGDRVSTEKYRIALVLALVFLAAAVCVPAVSASYLQNPYYAPGSMNPCFKIVDQSDGGYVLDGTLTVFMPSGSTKKILFKIDYASGVAKEYDDKAYTVIELAPEYQKLHLEAKYSVGKNTSTISQTLMKTKYGYTMETSNKTAPEIHRNTHPMAVFVRHVGWFNLDVSIVYQVFDPVSGSYTPLQIQPKDFGDSHCANHYYMAFLPPSARNIQIYAHAVLGKTRTVVLPNGHGMHLLQIGGVTWDISATSVSPGTLWGTRNDAPFTSKNEWFKSSNFNPEGFKVWTDSS